MAQQIIPLENGGVVVVSDYGTVIDITVKFPKEGTESINISNMELLGRELEMSIRERYT